MKLNRNEDEYICVQELQQRMAKLKKQQQAESEAEKLRLKEAHWMHCPKCGQKLSTEKCGSVEIDVCPSCKGCGWTRANWGPSWRARTKAVSSTCAYEFCVGVNHGSYRLVSVQTMPTRWTNESGWQKDPAALE
jgi:hypothetical protein